MIAETIIPILVYRIRFSSLSSFLYFAIKSLQKVVALKNKKLFRVDIIVAISAA